MKLCLCKYDDIKVDPYGDDVNRCMTCGLTLRCAACDGPSVGTGDDMVADFVSTNPDVESEHAQLVLAHGGCAEDNGWARA